MQDAPNVLRLIDIPKGSKLRLEAQFGGDNPPKIVEATYHRADGMFSFCTFDEEGHEPFHLRWDTPVCLVNGVWEIMH